LGKGGEMTVKKFLEKTKKFELEAYKKFPDLLLNHVPFTGAPQKHPYDKDKIILVADPFSTNTFYYEFDIDDIEGVEELPSLVTLEGESVTMLRLWVRKGSIGIKGMPFVVEHIPKGMGG
jgi:inorganic pyrophosphatase